MDKRDVFSRNKKFKKNDQKSAPKSGVIFVDESPRINHNINNEKVIKQVNSRIAQPVTETQMQTAKEGTSESMYNPSGGFERF